jgi:hypothetical protein
VEKQEIPCRIRVVGPPQGVDFRLQRGKAELVAPSQVTDGELVFDLTARVGQGRDGEPNLLGPFVQGPVGGRFVYVNSGTCAGQLHSCWTRRAKVPLGGITAAMIADLAADPSSVAEARIVGTGRDGGPACATVPLLDGGWRVVPSGGDPAPGPSRR